MDRRTFLQRMFQAGLVVATPKLIFDMGANKHRRLCDTYDYVFYHQERLYMGSTKNIILMGTPPGPNWADAFLDAPRRTEPIPRLWKSDGSRLVQMDFQPLASSLTKEG